ncbi:MAG TPA: anti-sigma factor [Verrucomicrobiae bacterium]|jgi:anti-sigma-K factor RskA|nr:anti-sigma factor [Verrucomicrobiae bacterium]
MIDERLQELASLHVLGALTPEESHTFEAELRGNAELREFVTSLSTIADAVAGSVPLVTPPRSLRDKILAQVESQQKIVPLVQPDEDDDDEKSVTWFPWALAACFAVLCGLLFMRQNTLNGRLNDLNQLTAALQATTNGLQSTAMALQTTNTTLQSAVTTLQANNTELEHALTELRKNNSLANIKVTVLNALLADEPKAVAVSLWNEKTQTGEFIGQSLTPLPADKDYQLWVIDPQYGTPVDAGVFQVDSDGKVRIQFKAKQPINTAAKFAVTREVKGGSPTPKGEMVLIGG